MQIKSVLVKGRTGRQRLSESVPRCIDTITRYDGEGYRPTRRHLVQLLHPCFDPFFLHINEKFFPLFVSKRILLPPLAHPTQLDTRNSVIVVQSPVSLISINSFPTFPVHRSFIIFCTGNYNNHLIRIITSSIILIHVKI